MALPNSVAFDSALLLPPIVREGPQGRADEPLGRADEPLGREPRAFTAQLHWSLADLESAWRTLEKRGEMTAYQRFVWVRCIHDHLVAPSSPKPFSIELRDTRTDETLMILPLALERRLLARVVTWLNFNVCDYAAPICVPDLDLTEDEALQAWMAVRAALPPFDIIDIVQIPTHVGKLANPLALLPLSRPMTLVASGIDLAGDAATLIGRVGGKSAEKELGKLKRRLDRRGTVGFVRAETEVEVEAIFAALVEQRRQRFKKLGRFDLLANTDIRAFYLDGLLRSLGSGPAQLWGLSVDGEWIATAYNLAHGSTFHGLILTTGTDDWKNCSPGLVMVGELMTRFARDGYSYFDFTVGDLPYKAGFGAKPRVLRRLLDHETAFGFVISHILRAAEGSKAWLETQPRLFESLRRMRRRLRQFGGRSHPE